MSAVLEFMLRVLTSRVYWITWASIIILTLLYLVGYRWRPAVQIQFKQRALLEAVHDNSSRKWDRLISNDYADDWGLTKGDASNGFKELRKQFFFLDLNTSEMSVSVDGDEGQFSAKLEVLGRGTPIGEGIKGIANGLDAPFVFVWRKESKAPWS